MIGNEATRTYRMVEWPKEKPPTSQKAREISARMKKCLAILKVAPMSLSEIVTIFRCDRFAGYSFWSGDEIRSTLESLMRRGKIEKLPRTESRKFVKYRLIEGEAR